jgi:hypothetical protein
MSERKKYDSTVRSSVGSSSECCETDHNVSETILEWCFVAIVIAVTIKAWMWVIG